MLLSNYLSVLMKPTFEKKINTVDDVLESGLKVFYGNGGGQGFVDLLRESPNEKYQRLAEMTFIPTKKGTKTDFGNVTEEMHRSPSWVWMSQLILLSDRKPSDKKGWHWYQGGVVER